jgi:hypothetical protein
MKTGSQKQKKTRRNAAKQATQGLVAKATQELAGEIASKVEGFTTARIVEATKQFTLQLKQLNERFVALKARLSLENNELRQAKGTAEAKFNQANQALKLVRKERDALVAKTRKVK